VRPLTVFVGVTILVIIGVMASLMSLLLADADRLIADPPSDQTDVDL
jgi:hypothetical protein